VASLRHLETRSLPRTPHLHPYVVEPGVSIGHVRISQPATLAGNGFSTTALNIPRHGLDSAWRMARDGHRIRSFDLAKLASVRTRYILNTPNFVSATGAFSAAENASASTRRVSDGAIIPSSHSRAVAKYGFPSRSNCSRSGCLNSSSSISDHFPPVASIFSRLTVARTLAACSPPMTEIRAFGQVNKKRGP